MHELQALHEGGMAGQECSKSCQVSAGCVCCFAHNIAAGLQVNAAIFLYNTRPAPIRGLYASSYKQVGVQ